MRRYVSFLTALLLTLMLPAALFAAGGSEDQGATGAEKVKLVYLTSVNVDTEGYDVSDNPYINYIKEKVGVDIQIISAASNYQAKVNTVMASGDLPDYLLLSSSDKAMLTQFALDGLLRPLDDLIPRYKNIKNAYPDEIWDLCKIDGQIMGVPMMRYDPTPYLIYVRQQWLKNVGVDPKSIKTVDDWHSLYVAFRDKDPDKNGKQDQYGLLVRSDWAPSIELFQDAFDASYTAVQDGQVLPNYLLPGYRNWLKWMARLYKDGLMDPEYVVTPKQQFIEKQVSNRFGSWLRFWSMQEFRNAGGTREELAVVAPPVKVSNGKPSKIKYQAPIRHYIAVTSASKHPDKVMDVLNWGLSDEGGMFIQAGVEGLDYDMVGGKSVVREDRMGKNNAWRFITLGVQQVQMDKQVQAAFAQSWGELGLKHLQLSSEYGKLDTIDMSAPSFPELADYDLLSPVVEFRDKAILGRIDVDAEWDNYVTAWKKAGGSEWIRLMSDWYNNEFTKK